MDVQIRFRSKTYDLGLMWGKFINVYGQAGSIQGLINTVMLLIVTYTTSFEDIIPVWLYVSIVVFIAVSVVLFVLKIGISGYYRFFSQQTSMQKIDTKLDDVIERLDKMEKELRTKA